MPRRKEAITPLTSEEALLREIKLLKADLVKLKQPGVTAVMAIDKQHFVFPVQGEVEWNYPNARAYVFHDHEWWPLMPPTLYIKLQKDTKETEVTEDNFKFMVGRDMHDHYLIDAEAYITTSGSITIGVRNNTQSSTSLLSSNLVVNSGQKNTKNSTPKRVINESHQVHWGDEIEVRVISVGGSAMGAGCMLTFSGKPLPRDLDG